jgi:hypothetical protein
VLIGVILVVVAVAVLAATAFTRRRSHDDVHSVDGYHRQLHTLEHISVHPLQADRDGATSSKPAIPESAVRLAGSPNVRVTDAPPVSVPPVAPPAVPDPSTPVAFDDATPAPAPAPPSYGSIGRRDRAMSAMNRRPRRLAAPAIAVAAVTLLIAVLLIAGSHPNTPNRSAGSTTAQKHTRHPTTPKRAHHTTTTTAPPIVSLPSATSLHSATYKVASSSFTLVLGASSGACWVDAVDVSSNTTLFEAVLSPGEQHTVTATGPVSIELGAPGAFSGTVDGAPVVLPYGYQTPFTMQLVPITTSSP